MTGIFPDVATGGAVVYRDIDGNPLNPPGIQNAYSPLPAFIANCEFTALPADCNGRIEAKQINAIVSELVSFAECLDPNGPWDCASLKNLCHAFTAWVETSAMIFDQVTIVGSGTAADPYHVGILDCGSF